MLLIALVAGTVVPGYAEGTHGAAPTTHSIMFGHQFYPTPRHVIERMLKFHPFDEHDRLWERGGPMRVLEPSAGSGAILDFIHQYMGWSGDRNKQREVHCCEIDPELNAMLHGKGYTVVGSDFLQFRTERPYNFIIMNPPFDAAAEHIVHAWEMLDGELVALCNAETVRNPRGDQGRRLEQLIAEGGKVEFIGTPFQYSERPTDVQVAMVRLKRDQDAEEPDWWKEAALRFEAPVDMNIEDMASNGVVRFDYLDSVVSAYRAARTAFRDLLIARTRIDIAIAPFTSGTAKDPVKEALELYVSRGYMSNVAGARDRHFASILQQCAWGSILEQTNLKDYATEGVRRNLNKLLEQQQALVFDRANIASMLELLFTNRLELLRQALVETFDRMCSFYPGNKRHWEGWKSNAAHMVNRKVVMPRSGLSYDRRWGGSFTTYNINTDDLDRAMAMLEGRKLSDPTGMEHLLRTCKPGAEPSIVTVATAVKQSIADLPRPIEDRHWHKLDNTAESEYFLIRYWKKGTLHLFFKDEALWQRFNQEGAKGKGWLPFDPDHVPKPKSTSAERKAIKELEELAETRRARLLSTAS